MCKKKSLAQQKASRRAKRTRERGNSMSLILKVKRGVKTDRKKEDYEYSGPQSSKKKHEVIRENEDKNKKRRSPGRMKVKN